MLVERDNNLITKLFDVWHHAMSRSGEEKIVHQVLETFRLILKTVITFMKKDMYMYLE